MKKLQTLLYVGSIVAAVGIGGAVCVSEITDKHLESGNCPFRWTSESKCVSFPGHSCNRFYKWGSGSGSNYENIYFPQCVNRDYSPTPELPGSFIYDTNCYSESDKPVSCGE